MCQARFAWRIETAGMENWIFAGLGAIANNRIFNIRGIILDWVRIGPCLREGNWVRMGIWCLLGNYSP